MPIATNGLGTYAYDLNAKGRTAGISYYLSSPDPSLDEKEDIATVWEEDGAGTLLESPGNRSTATGINDKGSVVGTWGMKTGDDETEALSKHAFLYRDGSMVDLGPILGTKHSYGTAINNSDSVVGRAGGRPFIYHAAGGAPPVFLGVLPGHDSASAQAINDAGVVVGFSENNSVPGSRRSFLYAGGPLVDLGPAAVTDISGTGLVSTSATYGGHKVPVVYDSNDA